MNIRKDDNVIVVSGKDKGKTGKVLKVIPKEEKVVVDGVNLRKKTQKPKKSGQKGQIIEKVFPIHVSNVMIVDPKTQKSTRVGAKIVDGKKVRISKKSGANL